MQIHFEKRTAARQPLFHPASSRVSWHALLSRPRIVASAGVRALAVSLLIFIAVLLTASAQASADTRIPANPTLTGELRATSAVAVSAKEHNDIYAVSNGQEQRVEQYEPNGNRVRGFGWGVVPGAATGTGNLAAGSTLVTNATTTSGRFIGGQIVSGPGIPPNTKILDVTSTEMTLSNAPSTSTSGATLTVLAAPGNVPTNEVQKLIITAASGEYTLTFHGPNPGSTSATTTLISATAPANKGEGSGSLEEVLEALPNIGSGNVSVSGGPGSSTGASPYLIEFKGHYADVNVRTLTTSDVSLAGGKPSSAATATTPIEGAGVLETCTAVCVEASTGEIESEGYPDSQPGRLDWADEMAIDNNPASSSYGDLYIVDERHNRVEKFDPEGHFLLMFGGGVDDTTGANVCTAADIAGGDVCGDGVSGTGPSHFFESATQVPSLRWADNGHNSIAVGSDGTVYVGDFERIQKFEPDGTYLGEISVPYGQFVKSLAVNGSGDIYANVARNNEMQRFVPPASGTFTLTFKGQTTAPMAYNIGTFFLSKELAKLSTIGGEGFAEENVDLFEYEGAYFFGFEHKLGEQDVPQLEASTGPVTTVLQGNPGKLVELGPSGELLQTLDEGGKPSYIGLDAEGDLVVGDFHEEIRPGCRTTTEVPPDCPYDTFLAYNPSNQLYAIFSSDQAHVYESRLEGMGVGGGDGLLYASVNNPGSGGGSYIDVASIPKKGPPVIKAEEVGSVEPTTATLHAVVNPGGFDTHYHFEYGETATYGHKTSSFDLGSIINDYPVRSAVSDLKPETTYHYRVVAESTRGAGETVAGPDQTFETLPPVSVHDFTTQTVGPELVTLKANLDPNGSEATYVISYGEDEAYLGGSSHGTLLLGNEFEEVTATFAGLKPNTTYHFQLTAEDEYGRVSTADQTFTTEPSPAEEGSGCPNANVREEINALSLPDCRAWEQVSPAFKAGSGAEGNLGGGPFLSADGERVSFASNGIFAGAVDVIFNTYLAHRTDQGWLTQAASLRPAEHEFQPGFTREMSPDLGRWLNHAKEGMSKEEAEEDPRGSAYYVGEASGAFVKATPTLKIVDNEHGFFDSLLGASNDFSRLFIISSRRLLESDPRPGHERGVAVPGDRIYEVTGAGEPEPALKLLVELPSGPSGVPVNDGCGIDAWIQNGMNQVSSDGSTLFYDAPLDLIPGAECEAGISHGPNKSALFAKLGESPPVQISAAPPLQCSYPAPCSTSGFKPAEFWGASPDGSRAWFTTAQPLINSDTNATNDLYLAKLEDGQVSELVQATAGDATDPSPGNTGLRGISAVSPEATSAAFVATGVLTTHENGLHQSAAQGAYNLYVYDADSGETKFVSRICSGPEKSGSVTDPACPSTLTGGGDPGVANDQALWNGQQESRAGARFTPDGRFLVFASYGRLTLDDTDSTRSVFRYDFSSGQLIRVSFGRDGNDANGNDSRYEALLPSTLSGAESADLTAEDATRAISADGSAVIFETKAPLVSHDTNEANDLYEWEEVGHGTCAEAEDGTGGCVRLLSDGLDRHGLAESSGRISASGRDITFLTPRGLVPTDTDGLPDVYDAREFGGFRPVRGEPPCEGADNCREAVLPPPSAPVIGTSHFVGPGNSPTEIQCARGRHKVRKHNQVRCIPNDKPRGRHRRKHHRHRSRTRPAPARRAAR